MAQEKESFLDNLHRIMALMGGAWIPALLIQMLGKEIYECSSCGLEVQRGNTYCPHCKARLTWKNV